jgi:Tfp pilus assembly PilM family ATPase
MPSLLSPAQSRQKIARIGFAVDETGVACAQVRRTDDGWQMVSGRTVSLSTIPQSNSTAARRPGRVADFAAAAAGFKGSDVAVVLPMDCCALRVLELPGGSDDELRVMLQNELDESGDDSSVFGFWKIPTSMSQNATLTTVCAISAQRTAVDDVVKTVQHCGFNIVGIDGLPTAMSRAATMCSLPRDAANSSTLAVHIGWELCTTVLISRGRPMLARVPRQPGMKGLVENLANRLNLSIPDVLRLLRGIQSSLPVFPTLSCLKAIVTAVEQWSQPLCTEILRSVTFSAAPGVRTVPSTAIIMGPGSILPGLDTIMTNLLNIATTEWSIATTTDCGGVPEFQGELAIPAAVSAWEVL